MGHPVLCYGELNQSMHLSSIDLFILLPIFLVREMRDLLGVGGSQTKQTFAALRNLVLAAVSLSGQIDAQFLSGVITPSQAQHYFQRYLSPVSSVNVSLDKLLSNLVHGFQKMFQVAFILDSIRSCREIPIFSSPPP